MKPLNSETANLEATCGRIRFVSRSFGARVQSPQCFLESNSRGGYGDFETLSTRSNDCTSSQNMCLESPKHPRSSSGSTVNPRTNLPTVSKLCSCHASTGTDTQCTSHGSETDPEASFHTHTTPDDGAPALGQLGGPTAGGGHSARLPRGTQTVRAPRDREAAVAAAVTAAARRWRQWRWRWQQRRRRRR